MCVCVCACACVCVLCVHNSGAVFLQIRTPGKDKVVCVAAFAGIHGISIARVRRLANVSLQSVCPPRDKRGKHGHHRRITDQVKQQIEDHIRSFPVMKSHYSRSHDNRRRKYLSPILSVADMHELYVKKYETGARSPVVSYSFYLKYFNENFNLCFGYPKTDTCGTCDSLRIQLDLADESQSTALRSQKEDHLRRAENFYSSLRTNTILAKENPQIKTISFDFQQNLPLPHIPVGEVFYMRQLWVHVFGIHDCGTNQAIMNCWPEFIAGKGSSEVISCLHSYFMDLPAEVSTLYLYSDGCPGQNKNVHLMHYLFALVKTGRFQHIQHHFPIRGHSFLPNDRDFGKTETKKKKVERVYTADQWYDII